MFEKTDLEVSDIEQQIYKRQKEKKKKTTAVGDETESDSDFEDIKKSVRGEKSYLEDYLTLGELSGKIPPSLLLNVNFE